MSLKHTFYRLYIVGILWSALAARAIAQVTTPVFEVDDGSLDLLEPINGTDTLPPSDKLGPFFSYFNLLYPWAVGMAAGIALLMTLVGGIQIIISGGDQGKRQAGTDRMWWSIAGLIMLAFSTLLLRTLNPAFFKF